MEHLREMWREATRCTNVAFEALTGLCPTEEIVDGGQFLEMITKAGYGYAAMYDLNGLTLRQLVERPEVQQGSFYLFTSGHALALVDGVLTDAEERGPDGRRVKQIYRITKRSTAARKPKRFSDFERGMRVVVTGHPDHPGTVVRIHGQGNAYTKGYLTIAFDSAPDRPVQYPWREVEIITPRTAAKTWREKVDALPGEYTPAIMSAVENVLDEGYSEDDDEFWSRVYGEVMA